MNLVPSAPPPAYMCGEVRLLLPLYPLLCIRHRHPPPGCRLPAPHPQVAHPGGEAGI